MPTRDRPTPPTGPGPLGGDHRSATRPLPAPPWIPLQPEVYRPGPAPTADPPTLLVWLRRALLLVAIAALAVAVAELVYRLGTVPPPPGTG